MHSCPKQKPMPSPCQGDHWVFLLLARLPDPCQARHCHLGMNRQSMRKPKCPNRNQMPQTRQEDHWVFLPLVLPPDPFKAHHCNLRVNRPSRRKSPCPNWSQMPQTSRPLGLSAAGSVARSFPGTLLQFASESSKPEEAGEAEESMECASLTSKESLAPLQTATFCQPSILGWNGSHSHRHCMWT